MTVGAQIARVEMIMGLPVSIHVREAFADIELTEARIDAAFQEMRRFDQIFSPYRADSTLTAVRAGRIPATKAGPDFDEMLRLAGEAKTLTGGAFDIRFAGSLDPSGLVKGWAAQRAGELLADPGYDWYLNAGGDITCSATSQPWRVGIEHPFDPSGLLTVVQLTGGGIATSGSTHRGAHVVDPSTGRPASGIRQVTVIAPSLVRADIWATAIAARGTALTDPMDQLASTCVADGAEFLAVTDDGRLYATPGFGRIQVDDLPRPAVLPIPVSA